MKQQVVFLYMLMICIMFYLKPEIPSDINNPLLYVYMIIVVLATVVHFIRYSSKNFFTITNLFLLGFIVVHFQWPIMLSFSDIEPPVFQLSRGSYIYINYGTWLSCMGLIAWFLGYAIANKKLDDSRVYKIINYKVLLYFNFIVFIVFIVSVGKGYLMGDMYSEGDKDYGVGFYVFKVVDISTMVLILATVSKYKDKFKGSVLVWIFSLDKMFLIFSLCYIVLFLMVGDRGVFLKYIFALLLLYGVMIKPIKVQYFLAACILGAYFLTLIGQARGGGSVIDIQEFSIYDFTLELGNSARNIYMSLGQVPEIDGFFYGKLWLGDILAIIPTASNAYVALTGTPSYMLGSPAYLTFLRFGVDATSGEGSTLVSDIYLNFGSFGVIFMMFLLGVVIKKLDIILRGSRNPYLLIVSVVVGCSALYIGRATLLFMLQQIVWSLVVLRFFVRSQGKE